MWIETKVEIIDTHQEELGIDVEPTSVRLYLDVESITAMRESIADGELLDDTVVVTTNDGEEYMIKFNFDELKKIIDENRTGTTN